MPIIHLVSFFVSLFLGVSCSLNAFAGPPHGAQQLLAVVVVVAWTKESRRFPGHDPACRSSQEVFNNSQMVSCRGPGGVRNLTGRVRWGQEIFKYQGSGGFQIPRVGPGRHDPV